MLFAGSGSPRSGYLVFIKEVSLPRAPLVFGFMFWTLAPRGMIPLEFKIRFLNFLKISWSIVYVLCLALEMFSDLEVLQSHRPGSLIKMLLLTLNL